MPQVKIAAFYNAAGAEVPVSAKNPMPVAASSAPAAYTSAAVQTITVGGTAQNVFAANPARRYLLVVNTSDVPMYLDASGAAATVASLPLVAGGGYYEPLLAPSGAISIFCATAGKTFVAQQGS